MAKKVKKKVRKTVKEVARSTSKKRKTTLKPKPEHAKSAGKTGKKPRPSGRSRTLKGLKLKQAAAAICSHLTDLGFDPVLTGKGCAAIYQKAKTSAGGLDFVISEYKVEAIKNAMRALHYSCRVHRTFISRVCPFEVSFLPPPLAVGDDTVGDVNEIKTNRGNLKMLGPTDCVRQRLASYYRFGDRDALDDAVSVSKRHEIDLELVRRWSHWEWASDKYEDFLALLNGTDS